MKPAHRSIGCSNQCERPPAAVDGVIDAAGAQLVITPSFADSGTGLPIGMAPIPVTWK